jgi:hypothetical protein
VHIKKHLGFSAMRKALSGLFEQIQDTRQTGKVDYCLHDCLMSALAMMFFKTLPYFPFSDGCRIISRTSNLKTMFG